MDPNRTRTLQKARLQALAVPLVYSLFGVVWILASDLFLESLRLPAHVSTRIAMIKGWIYVGGSTALILFVMRKAWSTLESAYGELAAELVRRKETQDELEALTRDLERRIADRTRHLESTLSELSLFMDSVSHDLRAPLRILSGYARSLLEDHGKQLGPEGHHMLERVLASADRMERMIVGLLELARHGRAALDVHPLEPGRTDEMVREIWEEIASLHPERSFHFRMSPLPDFPCDPAMMEHVWRNVLSNAAKYTRGRDPSEIDVSFLDGWFRVRDNGTGFDPKQASRIFKPFERLHRSDDFEGDGIGLALASRILERHGGAIEADSRPGEWTEMRFRIDDARPPVRTADGRP